MPLILDSPSPSTSSSTSDLLSQSAPTDLQRQRRELHHDADVVIVGAGILGSALAVAFGDQGRSVILLERSLKEPDRIVGELLQPGGVEALKKLGLRDCLEDIDAVPVKGYGVLYFQKMVEIPYPQNSVKADAGVRPEGRSFHHGRFVQQLRSRALAHPNVTVFETVATDVITAQQIDQVVGVSAQSKSGDSECFFGSLTVISDGYASKFRKTYSPHSPTSRSKFYGLELIDCPLPLTRHGHVVLGDNAPVLLYQIGTHETRALVDVPEATPTASVAAGGIKGHLRNVVLPSLPEEVKPSFEDALERGALRSMPNSFLPPTTNKTPGLILLGDALNMRHPLTGGGMTVALNDVVLLKELLSPEKVPDLDNTRLLLQQMRTFHWRRKNLTAVINILAQALYSLFAANDFELKYLQKGCFRYFQLGGNCIDGPVGLLAGIIQQPFVLFYHFFAVALLSIWILFADNGLVRAPLSVLQGVMVFWKACVVIFPYIFAELRV